jgi:hypothetical protein
MKKIYVKNSDDIPVQRCSSQYLQRIQIQGNSWCFRWKILCELRVLLHINSQFQRGVSMITKAMFKYVSCDLRGLLMGRSVNSSACVTVHSDIISLHSGNI